MPTSPHDAATAFGLLLPRLFSLARATGDEVVYRYAMAMAREPETWDDLVIAMTRALVENRRHVIQAYNKRLHEHIIDPPAVLYKFPTGGVSMTPRDCIQTAEEWPKTERTVIEVSECVYLRDFLRSWWRRLTKTLDSWY